MMEKRARIYQESIVDFQSGLGEYAYFQGKRVGKMQYYGLKVRGVMISRMRWSVSGTHVCKIALIHDGRYLSWNRWWPCDIFIS